MNGGAGGRDGRWLQLARYIVVGLMNTGVTLCVIVLLKSVMGLNPWLSNAAGYGAGVANSFVWNRSWVFHSHGGPTGEAVRFLGGYCLCYGLQLALVWGLTEHTPLGALLWRLPQWLGGFALSGYGVATLAGMAVYTGANFLYNRHVAFRRG